MNGPVGEILNCEKTEQPARDYRVLFTSHALENNDREKGILAVERMGITIIGDGKDSIIVRGQEDLVHQLRKFDWVKEIKPYNCSIQFYAIH